MVVTEVLVFPNPTSFETLLTGSVICFNNLKKFLNWNTIKSFVCLQSCYILKQQLPIAMGY